MLFFVIPEWIQVAQLAANGLASIAQLVQTGVMISLLTKISDAAWLLGQARKFCIFFDQTLIKYSEKVYGYFTQIVGGTLLTPEIVDDIMSRIYIIVGIFIFFKLAMVAIKYMLNPEQFADDKVGAQTMVKRVILGSLVIVMIPTIFSTATRLQHAIINDRVIEKIILPKDAYRKLIKTKNPGRDLAMLVFNGFFSWNNSVDQDSAKSLYNNYNKVMVYNDIGLFNKNKINEQKNDEYIINYVPIISTLAVGYLLFMLVKYAMEVAFRSFKLVFLQIMSPFVIVNYMLDTAKEEVMKKWVNATISTYIMIFIRVMTLWFATLISYYLTNGVNGDSLLNTEDPWLKALIILAVFVFLKDLPKLISEIFGYNLQENETIGGIMNQGVGILKGFAFGHIAMNQGHMKAMRSAGMASGALGAIGGGLGTASGISQMATAKGNKNQFQHGVQNALQGTSTMSGAFGQTTGMMGSYVSSYLGTGILSPLSQPLSASTHSVSSDRYGLTPGETEDNKNNNKQYASYVDNNIKNNNNFDLYKNGDKYDLGQSSSIALSEDGKMFNNPIVVDMANEIINNTSVGNSSNFRQEVIEGKINKEIEKRGTTSFSTDELSDIMSKVSAEISNNASVTIQDTKTPVAEEINNIQSTNSLEGSDSDILIVPGYSGPRKTNESKDGYENILIDKNDNN